jgi:hypothetical protein
MNTPKPQNPVGVVDNNGVNAVETVSHKNNEVPATNIVAVAPVNTLLPLPERFPANINH